MNYETKATKILVMDDDPKSRLAIRKKLQTMYCDVITAENDVEGFQLSTMVQPELILLNVKIKTMGGVAVCERLKKNPVTRQIPIVFLVPPEHLDEVILGLEIGAADYLVTPFTLKEFQIKIHKVLIDGKNHKRFCDELCRLERTLMAKVSEELSTTITMIRGFAEPLMQKLSGFNGAVPLAYLQEIIQLTGFGKDLVNEYKSLFGSHSVFEDINPVEIVEEAIKNLRKAIEEKDQLILMKTPVGQPLVVRADARHLYAALKQLISNANKYTQRGGTISVVIVVLSHTLRIEVADTGVGMSPMQQRLILEKPSLHHHDPAENRSEIGLGLTIVKSVVLQHRGSIGLESRQGQGSRFWIDLPLCASHP
ncbi:MAG: ATP-binding protein [Nitrospiria bacterium]